MTTTNLTPYARLVERLAAAELERIRPTAMAIKEGVHWSVTEMWATVPSSGGSDDYTVIIVDEPGSPLRCSCSCKAGQHAVACKHTAQVLSDFGLLSEGYDYEMVTPDEVAQLVRREE